jgi:hypothetical protein
MYLRKYSVRKSQKDLVRESQICKVPHLWKVRKSNISFKYANLRIFDLRNFFADHPPLLPNDLFL